MDTVKTVSIPHNLTKEFRVDERSIPVFKAAVGIQGLKVPIPIDLNVAAKGLAAIAFENWNVALAWVLKYRTASKTESPFTTTTYKNFKILGGYLNAKLDLSYSLLEMLADVGLKSFLESDEPAKLWELTVREEVSEDICRWVTHADVSKEVRIQAMKVELATLKEFSNPYSSETMPKNFNFFEAILTGCRSCRRDNNEIKKSRKDLRKAFKNFLDAYQAWISKVTNNPKYRTKKLGDAKTHLHTVRDSIEFYADDQSQHEKCSWLCVHAF